MRLLLLGVDDDGRSCLLNETEIALEAVDAVPGVAIARLFATSESPPPRCPPGMGTFVDSGLAPGLVQWYIVDHDPPTSADEHTAGTELHHRNAIELIVVLQGSADMLLADGPHHVLAGDCIIMPGLDHGLRTGPDGCRLMSFAISTPHP